MHPDSLAAAHQFAATNYLAVLTLFAILLSPIMALQISRRLDDQNEREQRKRRLFQTLMATRNARVSPEHVGALNAIDIVFLKHKEVTRAWTAYLDQLNQPQEGWERVEFSAWIAKNEELFTDLLFLMGNSLNFDFDKTHLKRSSYWPKAHGDLEVDLMLIRKAVVDILEGKRGLPVDLSDITHTPEEQAVSEAARKATRAVFTGERPILVKIERDVPQDS